MSIVGGLLRQIAPVLADNLEATGLLKARGGMFDVPTPSTVTEMFIGGSGLKNLEAAGMGEAAPGIKALEDAQKDWLRLPTEEWNKKWADSGIAYDPVANKAMMELSDENVTVKKGINLDKMPQNTILGFDEVFNADTLKKAYPDIGNVKIGFLDEAGSPRIAAFDEANNAVLFNRLSPAYNPAELKSNMLHEVQHFVQGKELFTKGEGFQNVLQNNVDFQSVTSELDKLVSQSSADAMKFAKQNKGLNFTVDNVAEALGALVARDGKTAEQALAKEFKSKEMARKFINAAQQDPKISKILMAKDVASQEYQRSAGDYMRVAGEIFARQTGERADMTASERLLNPAMRDIDTNKLNQSYNITVDNATAPLSNNNSVADAYFVPEWKLKEQTLEEKKLGYARKLNNPVKLADGARLSGFIDNSQEVFYGYDKNGEQFTIRKEYVKPEDIVGSKDSNKTAEMIKSRLPQQVKNPEYTDPMQNSTQFADPFAAQIPQSTIPQGL